MKEPAVPETKTKKPVNVAKWSELQETYIELAARVAEYAKQRKIPFFLWLRLITGQRLLQEHRKHLGTKMRNAELEVSLFHGSVPQASSVFLASQLLGQFTSVSQQAIRAEVQVRLQEALDAMDPLDREVLVLRHFEELSNGEVATILELDVSAASKRYVRALRRLKEALSRVPGLLDASQTGGEE
jgi:RNA polymerase sigma-70 factor (ECF subfamily)